MNPLETLRRGLLFARENPQIIYTLFLLVIIPLAFFYTSERFLQIARENQDSLERSRVGLLTDVFVEFAGERMEDTSYMNERIRSIGSQNETITRFDVLRATGTSKFVIASLAPDTVGDEFVFLPEEEKTAPLFDLVQAYPGNALTDTYSSRGARMMRTVRGIPSTGSPVISQYVVIDFSMAVGDQRARESIQNAYVVLFGVLLLIIILLARQAKIIDYATLYRKLKDVDRMKDDFVSMAAHELRSPLTIIRGYTEMVAESETLSAESRGHLANIDRAATQLNTLIGDILDVAKLQEGRMSFSLTTLDVSTEIALVVDSFQRPAQDKGLELLYTKDALPTILVDTDRFRQVMVNFIGNAIKYTPSGTVKVSAKAEGDMLSIRISDTGMGISAEDQQKLFQKFYRVKGAQMQGITGTGLGLWITQEIVHAMKGTISVESIRGKGTDFIVRFPLSKPVI
jgi:signal transduction histidine kinase